MKRLLIGILTGLIAGFFLTAQAGPPEGMVRKMVPMSSMCLDVDANPHHFTAVIGRLQEDYATHIAYTFDATPDGYQKIIIVLNPETKLGGVVMLTPQQTCIVFSGQSLKGPFTRADMPPGKVDLDASPEEPVEES